jgi:hypothetical protein
MSVTLPHDVYDALEVESVALGLTVGALARVLILSALDVAEGKATTAADFLRALRPVPPGEVAVAVELKRPRKRAPRLPEPPAVVSPVKRKRRAK